MKKTTTIKIDEKVLNSAKLQIPNISRFIEDCLRAYLLADDEDLRSINDELETIKQAKATIQVLSSKAESKGLFFDDTKKQKTWSKLWRNYRSNRIIDDWTNYISLGYDEDYWINFMETLLGDLTNLELVNCDDLEYATKEYKRIIK